MPGDFSRQVYRSATRCHSLIGGWMTRSEIHQRWVHIYILRSARQPPLIAGAAVPKRGGEERRLGTTIRPKGFQWPWQSSPDSRARHLGCLSDLPACSVVKNIQRLKLIRHASTCATYCTACHAITTLELRQFSRVLVRFRPLPATMGSASGTMYPKISGVMYPDLV